MQYMMARSKLTNSLEEFIETSYKVNFSSHSIASSISDVLFDLDPSMHRELQHAILPMVKEFRKSKSLKYDELKKDWERALLEWEQKRMWQTLTGY